MLLIIVARVFEFKSFGQIEIELYRTQLPHTTDGVLDLDVDLWPVKCGFAFDAIVRDLPFFQRTRKLVLGRDPSLIGSKIAFVFSSAANGELKFNFLETVSFENLDRKIQTIGDFGVNL